MFEQALSHALKRLAAAKKEKLLADYALIGGLAVARWAKPRATGDIDFIIRSNKSELTKLAEFLKGEATIGETGDPLMGSISIEVTDELGPIPVQLLLFPKPWESDAFENVHNLEFGGVILPIVDWKSLVLLKLYAGGPLDLEDAKNILATPRPLGNLEERAKALRVSKKLSKLLTEK